MVIKAGSYIARHMLRLISSWHFPTQKLFHFYARFNHEKEEILGIFLQLLLYQLQRMLVL